MLNFCLFISHAGLLAVARKRLWLSSMHWFIFYSLTACLLVCPIRCLAYRGFESCGCTKARGLDFFVGTSPFLDHGLQCCCCDAFTPVPNRMGEQVRYQGFWPEDSPHLLLHVQPASRGDSSSAWTSSSRCSHLRSLETMQL